MRTALIIPVSILLACTVAQGRASAQPAPAAGTVVSAKELTREQFQALSPDALIDFGNQRITKSEFLDRNMKAAEEAAKRLTELKRRSLADFEARRKEVLDRDNAALAEGNRKVQAEIARLVAADAAAHGPNWEARRKQAADLLDQAARATPTERSALEKKAADLIAPAGR